MKRRGKLTWTIVATVTALSAFAHSTGSIAHPPVGADATSSDAATPSDSKQAVWMRASESLSPFPLGERVLMAAVGRLRNGENCGPGTGTFCEVEGPNGVLHIYREDDVLVAKQLEIDGEAATAPQPLAALGIGTARSRAEVMRNVARFAPELAFSCGDHAEYVADEGSTICEAQVMDGGTIALIFTNTGQLWFVRQTVIASG